MFVASRSTAQTVEVAPSTEPSDGSLDRLLEFLSEIAVSNASVNGLDDAA
jgi:hypothetical protein